MDLDTLQSRARAGDQAAEKQLFHELTVSFQLFAQNRIWNEEDSRDIVQNALRTIALKYKEVDVQTNFAGWAYGVLNNKMLDYFKSTKRHSENLQRLADAHCWRPEEEPDPTLKSRLLECMKKVSRMHRRHARVLNLHYQGYTTSEICDKLKVTVGNLYMLLSRARSMMTRCLDAGDID